MTTLLESPLRQFTRYDWLFVFLGGVTAWYFFLNVFELLNPRSPIGFDVMPLLAGPPVVAFGWWAARLANRVKAAVDGLDEGAGLVQSDAHTIEAFHEALVRAVRFWSWTGGLFIAVAMAAGFAGFVWMQGSEWSFTDVAAWLAGVLGLVMTGVGFLVGSILGRLVGYGNLSRVMERHSIRLAGLSTPAARSAMRGLESVFGYAVLVTLLICFWLACWLVSWRLGYFSEYRQWQWHFWTLWVLALGFFILTGRQPVRAFHRRLDEIYGGAEARRALDEQLAEAQEDRRRLGPALADQPESAERAELDAFIADLAARRFRSPLLSPRVLDGVLIVNLVLLIVMFPLFQR
jgi:hypothetical protein